MKRRAFTSKDISMMTYLASVDLTISAIAERMNRTPGSVANKMKRLGIVRPSQIGDMQRKEALKDICKERRRCIIEQRAKQEQRDLESFRAISPCITERWQRAIQYTKAKIVEINGQKIYAINGKPVTIFRIMEIYNGSIIK